MNTTVNILSRRVPSTTPTIHLNLSRTCLLCAKDGSGNGKLIHHTNVQLLRDTLCFITKILEVKSDRISAATRLKVELEGRPSYNDKDKFRIFFCLECSFRFKEVMNIYGKLSPLLVQLKNSLEIGDNLIATRKCQDPVILHKPEEPGVWHNAAEDDDDENGPDEVKAEIESLSQSSWTEMEVDANQDEDPFLPPERDPLELEEVDVDEKLFESELNVLGDNNYGETRRRNKAGYYWPKQITCPFCQKYRANSPKNMWTHVTKNHITELVPCELCDENFLNDAIFKAHSAIHADERPLRCLICGETTPDDKDSLVHHLLLYHFPLESAKMMANLKKHTCDICHKHFIRRHKLIQHKRSHLSHQDKQVHCEFCKTTAHLQKTIIFHILETHELDSSLEKKHGCTLCEKKFVSKLTLERHQWLHRLYDKTGKTLKCEICEYPFHPDEEEALVRHMETAHGDKKKNAKIFKCAFEGCKAKNYSLGNLRRHERNIHPELLVHQCHMCEKIYVAKDFLDTHIKTHGKGPYECEVCTFGGRTRREFDSADELSQHMAVHNKEEKFNCDKCSQTFSTSGSLNTHKITKHDAPSQYKCAQCDKMFAVRSVYKEHMDQHHPTESTPIFNCDLCSTSKVFRTKLQLQAHVRHVHKNISCICEVCGLIAKDLRSHVLRIHNTSEMKKKHVCYFCGDAFLTLPELVAHIRTHTGERPYICHVCGKDFTQNHCLKKHFNVHKKNRTCFVKAGDGQADAIFV